MRAFQHDSVASVRSREGIAPTTVAGLRRRASAVVVAALLAVTMSGCAGMNEKSVSDRLAEDAGLNGALVEVQHPGAPWVNKIVIRMFVADATAEGVARDVRSVAAVAVDDPDLRGEPLTFMAVQGAPADFSDPLTATITDSASVMGSVADRLGVGTGVEDILELSAADVRAVAQH